MISSSPSALCLSEYPYASLQIRILFISSWWPIYLDRAIMQPGGRMAGVKRPLRIIALADLHDCRAMLDRLQGIDADLIAFCGDLHNGGSRETALPAALALARIGPPVIIIPGNMDHKDFVPHLWKEAGLLMLHGSSLLRGDVGFIGLGGMIARD